METSGWDQNLCVLYNPLTLKKFTKPIRDTLRQKGRICIKLCKKNGEGWLDRREGNQETVFFFGVDGERWENGWKSKDIE